MSINQNAEGNDANLAAEAENPEPESDLLGQGDHAGNGQLNCDSDDSVEEGTEAELEAEDEADIHKQIVGEENSNENRDDVDSEAEGYALEEAESERMSAICATVQATSTDARPHEIQNLQNANLELEPEMAEADVCRLEESTTQDSANQEAPNVCGAGDVAESDACNSQPSEAGMVVERNPISHNCKESDQSLHQEQDSKQNENHPDTDNVDLEDEIMLSHGEGGASLSMQPTFNLKDSKCASEESFEPECDQESEEKLVQNSAQDLTLDENCLQNKQENQVLQLKECDNFNLSSNPNETTSGSNDGVSVALPSQTLSCPALHITAESTCSAGNSFSKSDLEKTENTSNQFTGQNIVDSSGSCDNISVCDRGSQNSFVENNFDSVEKCNEVSASIEAFHNQSNNEVENTSCEEVFTSPSVTQVNSDRNHDTNSVENSVQVQKSVVKEKDHDVAFPEGCDNNKMNVMHNSSPCKAPSAGHNMENSKEGTISSEHSHLLNQMHSIQHQLQAANSKIKQQELKIKSLQSTNADYQAQLNTAIKQRDAYSKELGTVKQNTEDLFIPQIKELEFTIAQQESEMKTLKEKLSSHDMAAKKAIAALQTEMKARVEQITKMFEDANKDKADMVVKYAQAERNNMERQKALERLDSKIKDLLKERENLQSQIKDFKSEKKKMKSAYDHKESELSSAGKEIEKLKETINSGEVRVKWAQNKLKSELEAHKETKLQVEKTMQKLKEAKEETEQIRKDCQAIVRTYQESEEIKSNSLDQELKARESELLQERQEKTDQEEIFQATCSELEQLKKKHSEALSELQTFKDRAECLATEQVQNEQTMRKFRDMLQKQKNDNKALQERIEELVPIQNDFKRAQATIKSLDAEISELKISNKDLHIDMEACRKREGEKLEFTEKLSCKNAELQSENITLHEKCMELSSLCENIKTQLHDVEEENKSLLERYNMEHKLRVQQESSLAAKLDEQTKKVKQLESKIEDSHDEVKTLKKKHVSNVKDLTRQLQQAKRRLEAFECNGDKDTTSMGSRTSSTGSLNTAVPSDNGSVTQVAFVQNHNHNIRHSSPPDQHEYPVITEQVEPNAQVLIERIVKLQRALARKNEKIEFVEDHISQLVDEIQKKNKIIQSYALREEAGTMTPEAVDINKPSTSADFRVQSQFQKKHSIMGSLYSSHQTDGTMTLDLSLEINKKLQAVLEDTLLKNITLKESLDTLGGEIARLSKENRELQLKMSKNIR